MPTRLHAPRPVAPGSPHPLAAALLAGLLLVVVAVAVLSATPAGAEEPVDDPATETAREIPVTLGRPGNAYPDNGWFDSGPAVPLMVLATTGMLLAGAVMIGRRCRHVAVERVTPTGGSAL